MHVHDTHAETKTVDESSEAAIRTPMERQRGVDTSRKLQSREATVGGTHGIVREA